MMMEQGELDADEDGTVDFDELMDWCVREMP